MSENKKLIKIKNINERKGNKMITLTKEDKDKIRVFAGTSSEKLAEKIVKYLDMDLSAAEIVKFADSCRSYKSNYNGFTCKTNSRIF